MDDATSTSVATASRDSRAMSNSKAIALGDSTAEANSLSVADDGGHAKSDSFAFAKDDSYAKSDSKAFAFGEKKKPIVVVKPYKEILVCEDKFSCVAKEPCKDVLIKKCIKDVKKPGIDVCDGGFDFFWYGGLKEEKCGLEYCGHGYKCAEVIIKKCFKSCGDKYCDYGEECITAGAECEDYPYLEKICKDVYEPTCVPLTPYLKLHYKAPCKTIFKCEEEPSECGGKYCPKGYTCAVDYKKTCGVAIKPTVKVVEKPFAFYEKPKKVVPIIDVKYEPKKVGGSFASSSSIAADDVSKTYTKAGVVGDTGSAAANAGAATPNSGAKSHSAADGHGHTKAYSGAFGKHGGAGVAGADAFSLP